MHLTQPYLHFCSSSDSKLNPCLLPALISRLVTLTMYPLINGTQLFVVIHLFRAQAAFLARNQTHYKVRVVFSKPVHAVRARGGPSSPNHDSFKAKPSSHLVYVTLRMTAPTSPCPTSPCLTPPTCPTLSADAEPMYKHPEIIFSAQCTV